MKKTINFVINIDDGYVQQCAVTITSIMWNLNKNYSAHFYIFYIGYKTKPNVFKILEKKYKCKITCINANKYDAYFRKINLKALQKTVYQNYWTSLASLYRLLMFKYLPNNADYAYYLDADIVIDTDLSKLYQNFVDKKLFFATVVDLVFLKRWKENKKIYKNYPEFSKLMKQRLKYPYFCAGFYLADIKKCKQLNVFKDLMAFLEKHPDTQLADQDILNSVFSQKYWDKITYLDPSYDVFINGKAKYYRGIKKYYYPWKQIKESYIHPKVLHYPGLPKPWSDEKCNGAQKWWFYYKKSPAKLAKVKSNNRIK